MSNELIKSRIAAAGSKKANGHPNKNQTTPHPVSKKRGRATKG